MRKALLIAAPTAIFLILVSLLDMDHVRFMEAGITGKPCPDGVKTEIERTVRNYNKILSDFYASGGKPALINSMPASKQVKHEVFRDLGYVNRTGKILVYDLASLTAYRITLKGPGRAEAQYFEEWNYMYQNPDRTPDTRPLGFGKGVRYHLVKEKGGWLVQDWDPDPKVPDMTTKEFKF